MVYIHQTVEQGASIVVANYVPVVATVPSFTPDPKGTITALTVTNAYEGKAVSFNTTFNNTGNCRISNAQNRITITNSLGNQIWQSHLIAIPSNSMIPNFPPG